MNDAMRPGRCTVERPDHTFCDAAGVPGAPFPICVKHAARLLTFLKDVTGANAGLLGDGRLGPARVVPPHLAKRPVVYYVQGAGADVKIGWTSDLRARLHNYPPSFRLIAVEPGSKRTEALRHQQFEDLRIARREWFYLGPKLQVHVNLIVAWHGEPEKWPVSRRSEGHWPQQERPVRGRRRRLSAPGQLTIFDALSA